MSSPTVIESILQMRGAALVIVTILGLLSVGSWGVIFGKFRELQGAFQEDLKILADLRNGVDVATLAEPSGFSALPGLADRAIDATSRNRDVERTLGRARAEARAEFESQLSFLATVAGIAPFLGLLGTVWGIMEAFLAIGATGATSIGVVAPGVADALLTTLVGLAVAIPAVVGYNLAVRRIRRLDLHMESFASELVERIGETNRQNP